MVRQGSKKQRKTKKTPTKPTWQARKRILAELFDEAFKDAKIREAKDQMLGLFQQRPLAVGPVDKDGVNLDLAALTEEHVGNMFYQSPALVRWYFAFGEHRRNLLELAKEHVPKLRSFQKEELEDFLAATLLPTPAPWRNAANYLAPNVPVKVLPTGAVVIPPRSRLTNPQWGQVRDFMHSQDPRKRGPQPKAVLHPRNQGNRILSEHKWLRLPFGTMKTIFPGSLPLQHCILT
jgi:hypothetical protein